MNDVTRTGIDGPVPALAPTAFWFLRHGETAWNALNLSQGRVENPLNEAGIAQAHAAAALLRNRGITSIVSSPMQRARVTAEIVGTALGLPVSFDIDLQEVSFGVQEGQPMSEWFTGWVAGSFTPEGAESFAELKLRAVGALNRALVNPPVVLVVAHGALFRATRAVMGLEPNFRTPNAQPLFCTPPAAHGGAWTLTPGR
ncbi:MAG: histidine phosphatase family protein [Proteobacteria bacterium]|nr:histidine phosphatase family protein [Pseudomonadota bacterium]